LRNDLTDRLILWPVCYRLGEGYVDAVAAAAVAAGDSGFYVVETEAHWRELLGKPPAPLPLQLPPEVVELVDVLPPELVRATWASANRPPSYADNEAWWFSVDDLESAKGPSLFGPSLETAFVSATAQWAIIVSHEDHAVAGGNRAFIETLAELIPPFIAADGESVQAREQVVAFLREVKESWQEPMRWLPRHLAHVYGEARANELLHAAGFQ
jgi:hypothetical protein